MYVLSNKILPVANIDAIPNPKNAEPICNTKISLSPYMTRINPPIKKYKIISGSLDLFYIYSQYFKRKNHFYFSKAIFLPMPDMKQLKTMT